MKVKSAVVIFLVSVLASGASAVGAYAFDHDKTKKHSLSLEDKFYHKAKLIMSNKEQLGLSEEQANKVEELKMKTKKDLIRKNAELEILALDIKTEMQKDPTDINAVNALVDKKYDLKKEKAKSLVEACAVLKTILTKEQKEKMKELCKTSEKQKTHGPMTGEKDGKH